MRCTPVVFQYAQHGRFIFFIVLECTKLFGDFRGHGVRRSRCQGGYGTRNRPAFFRIVSNSHNHEHCAEIGVTQTKCPEFITLLGDRLIWKLCHGYGDFKCESPQPAGMSIVFNFKQPFFFVIKFHQVDRSQVTGRIIQEHVFRAGIGSAYFSVFRAGMPFVDGGMKLQSRIGTGPGRKIHFIPEIPGRQSLCGFSICPADQVPVAITLHTFHKFIGQSNRIVGILPRNGHITFRSPTGIVFLKLNVLCSLPG